MSDVEWCSVCSEPLKDDGYILTAPWPEVQHCCSLACVQTIVQQWADYIAEHGTTP